MTFLALVVLSLRPVGELERLAGFALVPVRGLVELVAPLAWATRGSVRAATAPETPVEEERAACEALLVADQRSARPSSSALREGRVLVHAEVVGRTSGSRDRVVVQLPPTAEVAEGMPVVRGDHYVGRVVDVEPGGRAEAGPRATVELVTAASFRIGARMSDAPFPRLVVGGLAPPLEGSNVLMLAAHKPDDRRVADGAVEVFEQLDVAVEDGGYAGLADGYRLGELVTLTSASAAASARPGRPGQGVRAVRPGLDYKAGLYQLVVLARPWAGAPPELLLEHDPFDPADWLAVDVALAGDPSFWREGRKLKTGLTAGVEVGAAVRSGARFVGRVVAAQALTADVALLGDRGLELPGLAWIDGREAPFSLGRLVCLGRTGEGGARLRWDALVPLPDDVPLADGAARAVVYTGSGVRGVPRGLLVGETLLPPGPGPHELVLAAPGTERVPPTVEVRRGVPAEVLGP